jgi:hypothetical protein
MKYRNNKIKKEHHILEGFDKFLNKMSQELPVKAIIPGVIRKVNRANKGDLRITFQYPTQTGAKILLKKGLIGSRMLCSYRRYSHTRRIHPARKIQELIFVLV